MCETPVGPCTDAEENPILASDLDSRPLVVGPGHQTIITDDAGEMRLVDHVWQVTDGGALTLTRQVWLDWLDGGDGTPDCGRPHRDEQPAPQ